MKFTKVKAILLLLQLVFFLLLPVTILVLQSNNFQTDLVLTPVEDLNEHSYKISMSVIVVILGAFLVLKKLKINNWLKDIDAKRVLAEHDSMTTSNQADLQLIKKQLKSFQYTELVINVIPIILIITGLFLSFRAVEMMVIKMTAILWVIIPCWVSGIFCSFLEIKTSILKNEVLPIKNKSRIDSKASTSPLVRS